MFMRFYLELMKINVKQFGTVSSIFLLAMGHNIEIMIAEMISKQ